jgi:NAD(P)-dependent dehydrogenase (short-subunit alcohol dehydrogenase family)
LLDIFNSQCRQFGSPQPAAQEDGEYGLVSLSTAGCIVTFEQSIKTTEVRMADAGVKVALVTGANKGIGFEIARQLGQLGMFVYLGARDKERGEKSAATLTSEGLAVKPLVLDVTDAGSIAAAASVVEREQGKLDVLVNNAGIVDGTDFSRKPSETPLADVRMVFDTNFFGVIAMIQAFVPLLRKSAAGRIVNLSSTLGSLTMHSDPNGGFNDYLLLSYNASKTALNAATVQFANELNGTSIKVNSVCPGYVATDLNNHSGSRTTEQGAKIAVKMATVGSDGPTGGYVNDEGVIPW